MKQITFIILALLFPVAMLAQFTGEWQGKLTMGQSELTLVFKFVQQDSTITGSLDVPQQGAKDLPIDKIKLDGNKITLTISAIGLDYEGTLNEGDMPTIEGEIRQMGYRFPVTLKPNIKVNRPQTPKGPFPYLQEEVVFYNSTDGNKLSGTLVKPLMMNDKTPVAVLISGSGQQNRDEEIMEHKPFWVIADHLARNGIATLRYDDRGIGGSEAKGLATATSETFKGDALAAVNYLKDKGLKNIGVIGHTHAHHLHHLELLGGIVKGLALGAGQEAVVHILFSLSATRRTRPGGILSPSITKKTRICKQKSAIPHKNLPHSAPPALLYIKFIIRKLLY